VALRLSDTGVGMSAEVMQQAFEPFFTTKPAGQGTGLGLAVAQELTQQGGGSLWVDSAPGQGTRFTLRLPQVTAPLSCPAD
jgi:signal transduction histidine kinase